MISVIETQAASCQILKESLDSPGDDNVSVILESTDVVILDARKLPALPACLPPSIPVVALVDVDQTCEQLEAFCDADEVIAASEVATPLFKYRLQRLVGRYRNPLLIQRQRQPEFDLIKSLVNVARDQIYVKDLQHRFIFASDRFADSNGLHIDDIIGRDDIEIGSNPIDVYGSPELGWLGFWAQDDAAVNAGQYTQEVNPEWRALMENTRENQVTRIPLKNNKGEVYALLVVSSDITDDASNVVDLKARGVILDRAFGAMKKAQESREIAEKAVMEKNKLLAAASHDLRQPLHAMGLFLDVLGRRLKDQPELELLAKIKRSSAALSSLFNSLLDISRLDAGVVNVNREHFKTETLLSALRSEFYEIGLQKKISVDIRPCTSFVYTDPILFERILRNLIQNAVSYTDEGSVCVECQIQGRELVLRVKDTGLGIAPEEHGEIFSEYYQIEHLQNSRTKGLGLGLAIVRRLADLLGLKIELSSELGSGSTFSVVVPMGESQQAQITTTQESNMPLGGQLIVIIDDECDILEGMANVLVSHDCEFITAESTQRALDLLLDRDLVPDVIVADYRLEQGLTGYQAIAEIREEFSLDIPAIIVTGDTSADRLKDAARSGCRLLHKPVKAAELIREITEVLH